MKTLGRHLIAEFFGCNAVALDDQARLETWMNEAAQAIGATVVASAFHRYAPQGVSGTLLIAESHLSIHTWPEYGYAAVDIFTCGGLDPQRGFAWLEGVMGASEARLQEIVRGIPAHVAEAVPLLPRHVTILGRQGSW